MHQLSLFEELLKDEKREKHLFQLEGPIGPRAIYNGKEVISFSSFNYFGLINNPRVTEAIKETLAIYGGDICASRPGGGNTYLHQLLEERLAEFKRVESVLLFTSDISGAFALFSFFLSGNDVIIMDELSDKKIFRFAGADLKIFPHRDLTVARQLLEASAQYRKKIFLGESVFEMEGDIFPFNELAGEIKSHRIVLIIDDTNGIGILGRLGRGIVDHFNLYGQIDIDIGSLTHAFSAQVGYVAGIKALTSYLVEHSPFYNLPTAPSPIAVASALAALDIVKENGGLIERLWQNAKYFRSSLKQIGFNTGLSQTPIIPIFIEDDSLASVFAHRLFEKGVYIPYFTASSLLQGRARLRAIVTAVHTKDDLNRALDTIESVGRDLRVIT